MFAVTFITAFPIAFYPLVAFNDALKRKIRGAIIMLIRQNLFQTGVVKTCGDMAD
jgi:hypothetical protein